MIYSFFVLGVLAAFVAWRRWQFSLSEYEPVRSHYRGLWSIQLRRRVVIDGHPNGKGGLAFARAHEDRIKVWWVAGLAVWRSAESIELPSQALHMVSSLTARDFDVDFGPVFREAHYAPSNVERSTTTLATRLATASSPRAAFAASEFRPTPSPKASWWHFDN